MTTKRLKRSTRAETAFVRDMERRSAFDLVAEGRAEILTPQQYPEPIRRFLRRERSMVHVKLSRELKRKLEARSRETGVPVDELARSWIEQGLRRGIG